MALQRAITKGPESGSDGKLDMSEVTRLARECIVSGSKTSPSPNLQWSVSTIPYLFAK